MTKEQIMRRIRLAKNRFKESNLYKDSAGAAFLKEDSANAILEAWGKCTNEILVPEFRVFIEGIKKELEKINPDLSVDGLYVPNTEIEHGNKIFRDPLIHEYFADRCLDYVGNSLQFNIDPKKVAIAPRLFMGKGKISRHSLPCWNKVTFAQIIEQYGKEDGIIDSDRLYNDMMDKKIPGALIKIGKDYLPKSILETFCSVYPLYASKHSVIGSIDAASKKFASEEYKQV